MVGLINYEDVRQFLDSVEPLLKVTPAMQICVVEYDEVAEMLKEDAEPLKREDTETEDIVEFERTNSSPENSNVPDN